MYVVGAIVDDTYVLLNKKKGKQKGWPKEGWPNWYDAIGNRN